MSWIVKTLVNEYQNVFDNPPKTSILSIQLKSKSSSSWLSNKFDTWSEKKKERN